MSVWKFVDECGEFEIWRRKIGEDSKAVHFEEFWYRRPKEQEIHDEYEQRRRPNHAPAIVS